MHPLITQQRAKIVEIAARHGAHRILVFGSYLRGSPRPDSDVDFLVEAGRQTSPWFPGGLVADLEELLGLRVDVVEPLGLHSLLRDRILAEAVPL